MPNTGRMNLLEEMGRIDSEKMNKNRRAEKDRVMSELNMGMKKGGKVQSYGHGGKVKGCGMAKKGKGRAYGKELIMKKLKPSSKRKKKSLGKLPKKVRHKMGFYEKRWQSKIMKKIWQKIIDKIFGKRCKCINKERSTKTFILCSDCGEILNG